jgi:hypothetical protein
MEVEPMKATIEDAIKKMAEQAGKAATTGAGSGTAMHLSQAALNLAHVLATFDNMKPKQED